MVPRIWTGDTTGVLLEKRRDLSRRCYQCRLESLVVLVYLHGDGLKLYLRTALEAVVLVKAGGAQTKKSPRCPHNCYFDSASGVLLPCLFLNLSVLELP